MIKLTPFLAAALTIAAPIFAQDNNGRGQRCNNASLRGTFGFTAQGFTITGSPVPAPLQGPFASSGVSTFDGQGNFTLKATSSFNGLVQPPATVRGTYNVNPDCTYTSVAENGVTFRSVIVDGGAEILILQTTPGVIITGQADKQTGDEESRGGERSRRCGTDTVTGGAYGFLVNGFAGPPTIPANLAGPLAGVGTLSFDSSGRFVLNAQRSVNGVLDPQVLSLPGSYTAVGPDCTFQMRFDAGFNFNATAVNAGREIRFIETDPGTAIIVTAKRI